MISLRSLTIFIMVAFMFLQAYMFGLNDIWALILMFISTVIIFNAVRKLQLGNRLTLRAKTKKGSWLYKFLSNEKSLSIMLISLFFSILFAGILTVVLKGIIISHGSLALFIIIIVISFSIFRFLNKENTSSSMVAKNLQTDIANHANNVLHIVLIAFVLNVALSLLLSAHDTMALLNSDITFLNFDNIAVQDAVAKTGSNHYTRLMVNLYLLLENFKLAVTTKMISIMVPGMNDRVDWFYLFYIIIFILNMMKLFGFSLAFILFQKGLESHTGNLVGFLNQHLEKIKIWYQEYRDSKKNKQSSSVSSEENNETDV